MIVAISRRRAHHLEWIIQLVADRQWRNSDTVALATLLSLW
jgi:hypothetical protein